VSPLIKGAGGCFSVFSAVSKVQEKCKNFFDNYLKENME